MAFLTPVVVSCVISLFLPLDSENNENIFFLTEPPQILPIDFEAEAFYEGDLAQANCVLRKGDRPVAFIWKFNGLEIFNSDDTTIVSVGSRTSILTLDPVRAHHQGNYSCTAINAAGEAEVTVSLTVNGTY